MNQFLVDGRLTAIHTVRRIQMSPKTVAECIKTLRKHTCCPIRRVVAVGASFCISVQLCLARTLFSAAMFQRTSLIQVIGNHASLMWFCGVAGAPFRLFGRKKKEAAPVAASTDPAVESTDVQGSGFTRNLTGKSRTGYSVRDSDIFQNRLHEWRVTRRYQGRLKVGRAIRPQLCVTSVDETVRCCFRRRSSWIGLVR